MSNTIEDLSNSVKRFLTSNTNLVVPVPGQAQNGESLMAVIDDGIMSAANNARVHAEKLHDFAANDKKGRTVLSYGCPVNLDRVPYKRFFSGTASKTLTNERIAAFESSLTDWPELTLTAEADGSPIDVSTVQTVTFGGTVHSPLTADTEYTVIETRENIDGTVTLVLGYTPGVQLSLTGSTVIFNTGPIKRFKTIKSAWVASGVTARPIKVQQEQAKMIRLMKDQRMSQVSYFPRNGDEQYCGSEYELTIDGRFGVVSPVSNSFDLVVSGNVWMDEYNESTDTDFLLDNGFDYMLWQTIIEMNHMLLKYVPRQEGTLSPPTAARDAAWDALVLWDSHSVAGNIYYDL